MAHRNRNGEKSLTAKLEHLTMSPMHVQPVRAWIDMNPQTRISTMDGQFQEPIRPAEDRTESCFGHECNQVETVCSVKGDLCSCPDLGLQDGLRRSMDVEPLNGKPSRKFLPTSWLLERDGNLLLACPCARCKSKATPLIIHELCGNS
jgi:hypothetical protein